MILFFGLLGCSQKPFILKKDLLQCRLLSSSIEAFSARSMHASERSYVWADNQEGSRADFTVVSKGEKVRSGYEMYNKQGFLVEAYRESASYKQKDELEYDCTEEWCWRKRSYQKITWADSEEISEIKYRWEGRTEWYEITQGYVDITDSTGTTGKTIYNAHFQPIKTVHYSYLGYSEEETEYDCSGDWCKIQSQKGRRVFVEDRPPLRIPSDLQDLKKMIKEQLKERERVVDKDYDNIWTGNRLDWERRENEGYTIYNKLGYPIEELFKTSSSATKIISTYDCRDKK